MVIFSNFKLFMLHKLWRSFLLVFIVGGVCWNVTVAGADESEATTNTLMRWNIVHRSLQPKQLYLYNLLVDIREALTEQKDSHNEVYMRIQNAVLLMEEIVDGINKEIFFFNPQMEYKFINICNFLKGTNTITLSLLRSFKEKIRNFDRYIEHYCLKKREVIEKKELDLLNKMTYCNDLLLNNLLKDEYLSISLLDHVTDVLIYRPMEFIAAHKLLTVIIVGCIVGGIWYFYVRQPEVPNPIVEERVTDQYRIIQMRVLNQTRSQCAFNALYNRCLASNEDIGRLSVEVNDSVQFKEWQQVASALIGSDAALRDDHLEELIAKLGINRENLTVIPDSTALDPTHLQPVAPEPVGILPAIVPHIDQKIAALRRGVPQIFIINDTESSRGHSLQEVGQATHHWFTVVMKPDVQRAGGILFILADSLRNRDITRHPIIDRLLRIFTTPAA